MNILIKSSLREKSPVTAEIKKRFRALLQKIGLPDAELSILLIGDRAMRTLNHAWRGKDRTTDVLSFSLREEMSPQVRSCSRSPKQRGCCGMSRSVREPPAGAPPEMLGDIVISVPVARRQAKTAGHELSRELERLLVHGLVHLLGYDHERGAREAHRMTRKEQQLLKKLG